MARLTQDQRDFVRGVVANALDSKKSKAHTKRKLATYAREAYRNASGGTSLKITEHNINSAIQELRDDGYIIMPDTSGQGLRCSLGKRNGTADALGIMDGIGHQKRVVASTIENQIVKPTLAAGDGVSMMTAEQGTQLIEALRQQTVTLADALNRVALADSRKYVLVPADSVLALCERNRG